MTDRDGGLGRLGIALVVTLVVTLLAVAVGAPGLVLLAIVGLGFVLVGAAAGSPDADLRLERSVDEERPRPGQSVTITLSVTNEGDGVASDVRVVDDVPDDVAITGGTERFATAVRPGETVSHDYEVRPPRGEHAFGSPTVRQRNLVGTTETTTELAADGTTSITCETLLDSLPLREQTIQFVGRTPTDEGGSGVEFYATREYRRGDPINRIDWHRLARTGDLATVEYREERAVTIVFVVDDRDGVHRRPPGGGPDSYDLSLYAASRGIVGSLEDGNRTGFATLSDDVWIEPGADGGTRRRVDDAVADLGDDGGERVFADGGRLATAMVERLPRDAQVVFCTPLSDDAAVGFVRRLRSLGRTVTVVSPDLTTGVGAADVSPGARIDALARRNRLDELRGLGAAVVDWRLDDPIAIDLARVLGQGGRSR